MVEPCSCTQPGFCPRHKFRKSAPLFHLCQTSESYRELWDREAQTAAAPEITVILERIGICHQCVDRPQGCWKATEYGCTIEYQKAARRAAEKGSCPIGKLTKESKG